MTSLLHVKHSTPIILRFRFFILPISIINFILKTKNWENAYTDWVSTYIQYQHTYNLQYYIPWAQALKSYRILKPHVRTPIQPLHPATLHIFALHTWNLPTTPTTLLPLHPYKLPTTYNPTTYLQPLLPTPYIPTPTCLHDATDGLIYCMRTRLIV